MTAASTSPGSAPPEHVTEKLERQKSEATEQIRTADDKAGKLLGALGAMGLPIVLVVADEQPSPAAAVLTVVGVIGIGVAMLIAFWWVLTPRLNPDVAHTGWLLYAKLKDPAAIVAAVTSSADTVDEAQEIGRLSRRAKSKYVALQIAFGVAGIGILALITAIPL